ncbi:replication factor C large subunit [methanogenic archaeon mixed culture ISO4-G1]|nr:replication factor C large subunit [methanogenic archaeon mixed culture ISO4-G1]
MDWTEKYRPQSLDDVIGNPGAVNTLRQWAQSWVDGIPEKRAIVLIGTPGIGKTTSALALANDMGWTPVEMNASDQRTGDAIENIALRGSRFNTFSEGGSYLDSSKGQRKLIILDEADNFFGNADRGAIPMITKLIKETLQPVILIVNDYYELSRKCSAAKTDTLQVTFQRPKAPSIAKALARIADNEGITYDPEVMGIVAEKASGDMRAAVRNLESLCLGQTHVTADMANDLSARDKRNDMYTLMSAIFRSQDAMKARRVMMDTDTDPNEMELWVDENLPYEYLDKGDLVRGYEKLSRADIFLGRVSRRQYYGFWSYAGDTLSAGVNTARMSNRYSHDRLHFPSYLSKMSRSKSVRAIRKSVDLKLAIFLHTSTRRVDLDVLPYVKHLVANDPDLRVQITKALDLEPEELGFLLDKKPDSKEVKAVYSAIESEPVPTPRTANKPAEPAPAPSVKKEAKEAPPAAEERKKGQATLFEF